MKEAEMKQLGEWIVEALQHHADEAYLADLKGKVKEMCLKFPVPGISARQVSLNSPIIGV